MMAKDVVRMRGQITNFYKMRVQMQSVSMQMQASLILYTDFLSLEHIIIIFPMHTSKSPLANPYIVSIESGELDSHSVAIHGVEIFINSNTSSSNVKL